MNADHIGEATNMVAPVEALSSKPVDDTRKANSSVKPTVKAVAVALSAISHDGPHKPGEHRVWLARQLLDSRLTEDEAYSTVAHSPAISDFHPVPIKPSGDTGELRERVAASIGSAWAHGTHGKPFDVKAETDAILDLIQSERP